MDKCLLQKADGSYHRRGLKCKAQVIIILITVKRLQQCFELNMQSSRFDGRPRSKVKTSLITKYKLRQTLKRIHQES